MAVRIDQARQHRAVWIMIHGGTGFDLSRGEHPDYPRPFERNRAVEHRIGARGRENACSTDVTPAR